MHLTFLTPLAALVGVAVLVPLAAVAGRERQAARLRRALGLGAPPRLARLARAVALVALVGLLSAAAAQPALRDHRPVVSRRDAQAFFVLDISRSMLAAQGAQQPTRFMRAIAVAERLRAQLGDVPSGIATMTDRVLPNLFPSSDAADFDQVAERSLAVDRPPPAAVRSRSTDFGMLNDLVTGNYFGAGARHRLVVLLTDGESSDFDVGWIAKSLRGAQIDLIVVRFWHQDERIYTRRGAVQTGYRPDATAARPRPNGGGDDERARQAALVVRRRGGVVPARAPAPRTRHPSTEERGARERGGCPGRRPVRRPLLTL
jgi:hypothetical protein